MIDAKKISEWADRYGSKKAIGAARLHSALESGEEKELAHVRSSLLRQHILSGAEDILRREGLCPEK
jgi:hypothetical protein